MWLRASVGVMTVLILAALVLWLGAPHESTLSECKRCGMTQSQKWFAGVQVADELNGQDAITDWAASLNQHPHDWVVMRASSSGWFHLSCGVGGAGPPMYRRAYVLAYGCVATQGEKALALARRIPELSLQELRFVVDGMDLETIELAVTAHDLERVRDGASVTVTGTIEFRRYPERGAVRVLIVSKLDDIKR